MGIPRPTGTYAEVLTAPGGWPDGAEEEQLQEAIAGIHALKSQHGAILDDAETQLNAMKTVWHGGQGSEAAQNWHAQNVMAPGKQLMSDLDDHADTLQQMHDALVELKTTVHQNATADNAKLEQLDQQIDDLNTKITKKQQDIADDSRLGLVGIPKISTDTAQLGEHNANLTKTMTEKNTTLTTGLAKNVAEVGKGTAKMGALSGKITGTGGKEVGSTATTAGSTVAGTGSTVGSATSTAAGAFTNASGSGTSAASSSSPMSAFSGIAQSAGSSLTSPLQSVGQLGQSASGLTSGMSGAGGGGGAGAGGGGSATATGLSQPSGGQGPGGAGQAGQWQNQQGQGAQGPQSGGSSAPAGQTIPAGLQDSASAGQTTPAGLQDSASAGQTTPAGLHESSGAGQTSSPNGSDALSSNESHGNHATQAGNVQQSDSQHGGHSHGQEQQGPHGQDQQGQDQGKNDPQRGASDPQPPAGQTTPAGLPDSATPGSHGSEASQVGNTQQSGPHHDGQSPPSASSSNNQHGQPQPTGQQSPQSAGSTQPASWAGSGAGSTQPAGLLDASAGHTQAAGLQAAQQPQAPLAGAQVAGLAAGAGGAGLSTAAMATSMSHPADLSAASTGGGSATVTSAGGFTAGPIGGAPSTGGGSIGAPAGGGQVGAPAGGGSSPTTQSPLAHAPTPTPQAPSGLQNPGGPQAPTGPQAGVMSPSAATTPAGLSGTHPGDGSMAPGATPVSDRRLERETIMSLTNRGRKSTTDPVNQAVRFAAAVTVASSDYSFGLEWVTVVCTDGTIMTANSMGVGYVPAEVRIPESIKFVGADPYIPLDVRRSWATYPQRALLEAAELYGKTIRVVIGTEQSLRTDMGVPQMVLEADDFPQRPVEMSGQSPLQVIDPMAAADVAGAFNVLDLLPPQPVNLVEPEDQTGSLWLSALMIASASMHDERHLAHLAYWRHYCENKQELAVYAAYTAAEPEDVDRAVSEYQYWTALSDLVGPATYVSVPRSRSELVG